MHEQAELGVAAHWRYKERGGSQRAGSADAAFEPQDRVDAAGCSKRIRKRRTTAAARGRCSRELDAELVEDRVYALTPQGEVIDLPKGATPLDFAYHVHTEVGHRCRGAKVDGRIVPLDHVLHSGDRVEILTAKTGEPRRDWLVAANKFLASARSREKVRNWFHKLDRARNLQAGREMLDRELKRVGVQHADLAPALRKFNVDTLDDLHVLVALGDVGPHQVARALLEHERARRASRRVAGFGRNHRAAHAATAPKAGKSAFTVEGVGNLLVQIARCCQPLPGEAIAGYLTRGRGVSVHRADCAAFLRLSAKAPQRVMPVEWGQAGGGFETEVAVDAVDRKRLLKDVTNLIAQEDAHVLAIAGDVGHGAQVRLKLKLRVQDFGQLSRLLGKIEGLAGVEQARRA